MSRTTMRLGGAAVISAIAVGALISPALATDSSAAIPSRTDSPAADAVAALAQRKAPDQAAARTTAPPAVKTALITRPGGPLLAHLTIPRISANAASQGYAARDLGIDAAPDLPGRDLAFELQRLDGDTWTTAFTGTTSGDTDTATVPNLPAGTYRVAMPGQHGLEPFVGEPIAHQPRALAAALAFSAGDAKTSLDVNPDPAAVGTFQFTLESKNSGSWVFVGNFATNDAAGGYTFSDLASGTYRVVVPDQADAIGAVSNEVTVKSLADQRAEAERAAREAAATAARAQSRSQAPTGSRPVSPPNSAPIVNDVPASASGGGIVGTAMAQVGDAYRLGATGPNVFDCSGLTSYAYRAAGISIPRTAGAQYGAASKVSNPQPGDLVFFLNGAQHVGIYLGNGMMVHAANPSRGVEVTSISSGWYARTFTGYGRY